MKITRLVRNVHNTEKIAIYIDSKYTFSVLESILASESLYVGKDITQSEIDDLKNLGEYKLLKQKVLKLISLRPRSEAEIRTYLQKKTTEDMMQRLINELVETKEIDDEAFAKWWRDQRRTFTNKSAFEINIELRKKGLSQESTRASNYDPNEELNEVNAAKELIKKKNNALQHKNYEKNVLEMKVKTFLQRKGFSWDTINQAMSEIEDEKV
jgi:regulatory protein